MKRQGDAQIIIKQGKWHWKEVNLKNIRQSLYKNVSLEDLEKPYMHPYGRYQRCN